MNSISSVAEYPQIWLNTVRLTRKVHLRHKPINAGLQWKDWSQITLNSVLSQGNMEICPLLLEVWYHISILGTKEEFWIVEVSPGTITQIPLLMSHWPLCLLISDVTTIQSASQQKKKNTNPTKQCSIWALFKVPLFCNFCVSPRTL